MVTLISCREGVRRDCARVWTSMETQTSDCNMSSTRSGCRWRLFLLGTRRYVLCTFAWLKSQSKVPSAMLAKASQREATVFAVVGKSVASFAELTIQTCRDSL
ncbi:unnamed protein product [Durusdinium trenchii]|uniref:Uncharacterized protein n=1 Tax=Durusdinium trenchii TaxID=1381693 RepID=A0ABP0SPB4_9DINO